MHAVIMAGGRGTRFWPRSREKKPKHLLDIVSNRTIIQETVDRIKPLIKPRNILIVTGKKHARELMKQLPEVPAKNILIEPDRPQHSRLHRSCRRSHSEKNQRRYYGCLTLRSRHRRSCKIQSCHLHGSPGRRKENALVTIGIQPTSPHTGFGYMEGGASIGQVAGYALLRVKSFREKPDRKQAQAFLQSGNFFWNSGMFVWKASTIIKEIERFLPDLYSGLMTIKASLGNSSEAKTLSTIYKGLASISIDYGVMEKAKDVFVIPASFGWSDVGSWDALWEISSKDSRGNALAGGSQAIFESTENALVYSPNKLVALVGMKDVIVVETKDALLICKKGRSQDVKKIVDALEARGQTQLL